MAGLRFVACEGGFDLRSGALVLLRHRSDAPAFFVGRGDPLVDMYRGNFTLEDRLDARIPLAQAVLSVDGASVSLAAAEGVPPALVVTLDGGALAIEAPDAGLNRLWFRLPAEPDERMWGGGEQMSYVDMRGRRFPLWTSEPGVGRDKSTLLTFQADHPGKAGGDYWNTNYPQPTGLSSRLYAFHVDTTAYVAFDFRAATHHEIEVWAVPARLEFWAAESVVDLVGLLSTRFGRQPRLPDWAISGAILGLKDGIASFDRMERIIEAGAVVTGLWCEDWVGLRETGFGKRLFWNWQASDARYPGLHARIAGLAARGIRFLGYVNPYLCDDGAQFREAADKGYLARRLDSDEVYLVDFGEFECGIVDFTDPAAADWFAEDVIGRNMIDFGLAGWMADFGEYLPTDVRLANGIDGMLMHNAWPVIWAEVNARAVASRGRTGDVLFFMRAGWSGVGAHCPLLWAGDQSVDFSRHDGIGTVIRGALSSGLVGNAYHHSDLGGYTSLFGNVRTPELLMRWSELAAFSPVMRSHEGNRPGENLQLDGDAGVLAHFARMTRIHAALAPYVGSLCDEAVATGLPLQRALFLHFPDDRACHAVEDAYLYGADLLVAPIVTAGAMARDVYLPAGCDWIDLWTREMLRGGQVVSRAAPFGKPPVLYRAGTRWSALFDAVGAIG